jgi:GT2 family glycosyltransferase
VNPAHVTVVIVTWRSAALTVDCLASLAHERGVDGLRVDAVVVDNASGDAVDIAAAVVEHGWSDWVRVVTAARNGGFAYGNNVGFREACRHAQPDFLHMLNPDTEVRCGAVQQLVDFLQAHPDVGIAGSSFENADGSDWPIAFRFPSALSEFEAGLSWGPVSRLLQRWAVPRQMMPEPQPIDWGAGASMMIRRSVLDRIGGLDENYFLYFEETEFFWRARRAGFLAWYVPASRVMHIAGQSTGLTERDAAPRRLPAYWFESRRRYFLTTGGPAKAILIDLLALLGHALGRLKLRLLGRQHRLVPHYLGDLWVHSTLHPRNRVLAAPRTAWRDEA